MAARNPKTHCKVVQLMVPVSVTGTVTLNNTTPNFDVDCLGYASALVVAYAGATATAGGDTVTIQVKETATPGSAYANVSGAVLAAITGTSDNATRYGEIALVGRQRYLSITATAAGTVAHTTGVLVILFHPKDSSYTATLPAGASFDFSV